MAKMLLAWLAVLLLSSSEALKVTGSDGALRGQAKILLQENDKLLEALEKKDFLDINKGLKGLIHGDVYQTRSTIVDGSSGFWPTTTIPVKYGVPLSLEAIGSIELARREYRLRTCLDFVDRTTETDYITYKSLSGCYSSVGKTGGSQTISIGSGCERLGTVCHEMMHAIGIWHEQSRPDRDDYVEIMWDDITPGYEHNFDKYDFDTTDIRRVPYDYNSVMHYSDSGFSATGNPTIVTRDPAFQDVIGQRSGFSIGDTEKINRMYKCSDTLLYTYNCNFDDEAACGYSNNYNDDIDWIRYVGGDKNTAAPPNAPTFDTTYGADEGSAYLVLDTTAKTDGNTAQLKSMRFRSQATQQCLQFAYYISKDANSDAAMVLQLGTLDSTTGDIVSTTDLVTFEDDTSGKWVIERRTIEAPSAYRIVFEAKTSIYDDTFALDDISVQDKPCEDGYFVIDDYSSILSSFSKGDAILSPIMTSTQGYDFQVKLYPQGSSSASDGYMSMYFGIVQGPNDDNLDWPFCNKYIRMMVADQNNNPLYSMNAYSEFVTSQSAGGDLWNKPTSAGSAGFYGYRSFMKISDLQYTHNYLKGNRLMVSVLIQDMNWVNNEVCSGSFTRDLDVPAPMKYLETEEYEVQEVGIESQNSDVSRDAADSKYDDCLDKDDDAPDGYVTVGTTVGITLGVALFVFLIMSIVMCYMVKANSKQKQLVPQTVQMRPLPVASASAAAPPPYADNAAFQKAPIPNV